MIKQRDDNEPWILFDTKRDTFNPAILKISPDMFEEIFSEPSIMT